MTLISPKVTAKLTYSRKNTSQGYLKINPNSGFGRENPGEDSF